MSPKVTALAGADAGPDASGFLTPFVPRDTSLHQGGAVNSNIRLSCPSKQPQENVKVHLLFVIGPLLFFLQKDNAMSFRLLSMIYLC